MASINREKKTPQKAGAMYVHLDQDARMTHNHDNENIDTSKTPNNYIIGAYSYKDAMTSMKARTKAVDAIQPPSRVRKDRVTCCMIEFPCPKAIELAGKAHEFLAAHRVLMSYFGADNVHGTFVHVDEVHTYVDSKTKELRESLVHAHTLISAYTPEKGINGKAFETKARLNDLNSQINMMCLERFGVEYNTHEDARHQSVEKLKIESEVAALEKELAQMKKHLEKVKNESMLTAETLETATTAIAVLEDLLIGRTNYYPTEVEITRRGIISKEEVAIMPKSSFDDMLDAARTKDEVLKAIGYIKSAVKGLSDGLYGKTWRDMNARIRELEEKSDFLASCAREHIEYEDKVKAAVEKLSPSARREFKEAMGRDCQRDFTGFDR